MKILSINFGHDASLALMDGGQLLRFAELERSVRLKHCLGVVSSDIENFLDECRVGLPEIDLVAITSTQFWGAHHSSDLAIGFGYNSRHRKFTLDSPLWREDQFYPALEHPDMYASHLSQRGIQSSSRLFERLKFQLPFPHGLPLDGPSLNTLVENNSRLVDAVAENPEHYRAIVNHFVTPCILVLKGTAIPGFHVGHHFAHAAYSLYYAEKGNCLIVSHDGGLPLVPFNSGGVYAGSGNRVIPLLSHKLPLGYLYEEASALAGFGRMEGPGKLMGLAPYGIASDGVNDVVAGLLKYCQTEGDYEKREVDLFIDRIHSISQKDRTIRKQAVEQFEFKLKDRDLSISLAANAQKLVEETFSQALSPYLSKLIGRVRGFKSLELTGGFALNCPVNTQVQNSMGAMPVNPLPGAIDAGLSIGAAVALLSYLGLDFPRPANTNPNAAAFPCDGKIRVTADERFTKVELSQPLEEFMAEQIAAGKVFGLCRGCSEVGPRALGHRSLLAKASSTKIRDFINIRKGRESWRPLAPMCRLEDFRKYFAGKAQSCRFMLFTCPVISDQIRGVTHVDGTARVQTIDDRDEPLHRMLGELPKYGEPAVVINTSFNTAGEPIVETGQHAFDSFLKLGFDFLVIEESIFRINQRT